MNDNLYFLKPALTIEDEISDWAEHGVKDLERYLAAYAAWSEWESQHG